MANHRKMTENEKSQILVMDSLKLSTDLVNLQCQKFWRNISLDNLSPL